MNTRVRLLNNTNEKQKCIMSRVRDIVKQFTPYALHLTMVAAVVIYVVGGAIAIRRIEATPVTKSGREQRDSNTNNNNNLIQLDRSRQCVLEALRKLTKANCTFTDWRELDNCYAEDLRRIGETRSAEEAENSSTNNEIIDGFEYWTIMDSVLFCFTVITTIGYGNVAPKSFEGRLFVIIYGLIGVPFTMMAIANIGKFLATLLRTWTRPFLVFGRRMKRLLLARRKSAKTKEDKEIGNEAKETQRLMEKSKKKAKKIEMDLNENPLDDEEDEDEEIEESEETETLVLFLAFIIYIVVGSIVIAAYEPEMDFFEAIYFNFVTLTTIGLGDLVPQSDTYLAITLIYCAIGLALTTIAIEIAADTLKKLHYFGRKIDNVANVQVWFGGQKISMKALVKNLGDQFNVPIDELDNLDLGKFVDDAIKVEAGELATLRNDRAWMNSNYWRAIESGSMHYVDDDDLVTLQSNPIMKRILKYPVESEEQVQKLIEKEKLRVEKSEKSTNLMKAFREYEDELKASNGCWNEQVREKFRAYQQVWKQCQVMKNSA